VIFWPALVQGKTLKNETSDLGGRVILQINESSQTIQALRVKEIPRHQHDILNIPGHNQGIDRPPLQTGPGLVFIVIIKHHHYQVSVLLIETRQVERKICAGKFSLVKLAIEDGLSPNRLAKIWATSSTIARFSPAKEIAILNLLLTLSFDWKNQ
jgi:hypothetical protein